MFLGVTDKEQKIIEDILDHYADSYSFYYYGSRVKGNFEKTSDLYILIKGKQEIPPLVLSKLKEKFDASHLPYIVNFSDYYKITSDFYNHIKSDLVEYKGKQCVRQFMIDVKNDTSLFFRFSEAIRILATGTGNLNRRIYDAYFYYIQPIYSEHFKDDFIREKLKYVESIMYSSKVMHYKDVHGGRLYCHWKISRKIAEAIFDIYLFIVKEKNNSNKSSLF